MENYICINGKKTVLTDEQIRKIGLEIPSPLTDFVNAVHSGNKPLKAGSIIEDFGMKFKVLGYDHDFENESDCVPTATLMSLTLSPPHRMLSGMCPDGWKDSELRKWLNGEFFDTLPDGLKKLIGLTLRRSNDSNGNIHTTKDHLFLPTESELFGSAIYSACECGARYEAFTCSKDRIVTDEDGDARWYFTSSAFGGNSAAFVCVDSDGNVGNLYASNARRAPFCFRVS